ncbi:glycosyltransferase family 2 protein [Pseudomonas protegens]|uniref:Glycosyltransferase family 2 protein n=1 Tax=Pseudomonas protegens TaxID=380021 RepID=A0A7G7XIW2_9PSED|nr:glycosyltransferase family 2 protein [Pseudomonas protegens]QNH79907.1 glycosyltransferase family 2 protein [Pseudomonas protegens]QNL03334.1 glycosyltransferase family 2 protein [Pseudomonas protegens]
MTNSEVLISVVVPTYNYAHLLPRALDSVLGQWAADLELIVVDDGSTDNTAAVLADYAARFAQLQVNVQTNAGAAAARNFGIRRASGRYVLLLDADDELVDGAFDELRRVLQLEPSTDVVLGAQVSVDDDGRERLRPATPVPRAATKVLARQYLLSKRISISHCCTLFSRKMMLQRPYPEALRTGEDIAVFAYLVVNARFAVTGKPLARIHKHRDSLRHSRDDEEQVALKIVDEVFSSLPEECQPLKKRYKAQRYLSLFRAALLGSNMGLAQRFYLTALSLSPLQAMRWTYLRKAVRLWFKRGSARG